MWEQIKQSRAYVVIFSFEKLKRIVPKAFQSRSCEKRTIFGVGKAYT